MESWLRGTTPWAAFHHSDRADYLAAGDTDVSLALGTERLVDTLLAAAMPWHFSGPASGSEQKSHSRQLITRFPPAPKDSGISLLDAFIVRDRAHGSHTECNRTAARLGDLLQQSPGRVAARTSRSRRTG